MVKNNLFNNLVNTNKKEKDNSKYENNKVMIRIKKKEPISSRIRKKENK